MQARTVFVRQKYKVLRRVLVTELLYDLLAPGNSRSHEVSPTTMQQRSRLAMGGGAASGMPVDASKRASLGVARLLRSCDALSQADMMHAVVGEAASGGSCCF